MGKIKLIGIDPLGKDQLGGAHENIASSIKDIIKNDSLSRKIIGLEGKWGSGKSNVVKILETKLLEDEYIFFYYDAWAHQNELDKKTFLEELLEFLIKNEMLSDKEYWKKKKDELLALTVNKNIMKVPKINKIYIYTLIALFTSHLLKDIFNKISFLSLISFLKLYIPFIKKITMSTNILGLLQLLIIYFPYIFLVRFILKEMKKQNLKLEEIFYFAKGERIDITNKEVILEKKMRHGKFREYLNDLQKSLKNRKLIIVFDNIDRLPKQEITLLWSLIHTYFAEDFNKKEKNEIFVIIPYERGCIEKAFDQEKDKENLEDCFISKTIEINFNISEPILTDWKKYFKEKFKSSFENVEESEIEIILQLYKRGVDRITPRGIITFLNYILTLQISNINKEKIKLRYYGLFYFLKNLIEYSENILTIEKIDKDNIKRIMILFIGDNEITKNISAIYFNVELDKAMDILLVNKIENDIISENKIDDYETFPQFYEIFGDIVTRIREFNPNEVMKVYKAISSLNELKEQKLHYNNIYEIITSHFLNSNYEELVSKYDFKEYTNLVKDLSICNKNLCEEIVKFIVKKESENNKQRIEIYINKIDSLAEVLKNTNLNIFSFLKEKNVSPDELFYGIEIKGEDYKKYLLKSEEKDITEFLLDQQKMGTTTETVYGKIEAVSLLKKEYNFKQLETECENRAKNNSISNNRNQFYILYLYRLLTENKKDKKILPNCNNLVSYYNLLFTNNHKDMKYEKVKYDFDLIIFKNQQNPNHQEYQHFVQHENFEKEEEREILRATEYYFSFEELIESFLTFSVKFKIFGFLIENYNNKTGILKEGSLEKILKSDYKELMRITENNLEVKDFIFMHEDIIKTIIEKVKIQNISLDFLGDLLIQYKEKNKFDSIIEIIKDYLNDISLWGNEFGFFNFKGNLYFKVIESGIKFDIKDQIIEKFLIRIHNNIKNKTNWYGSNNKIKMKEFLESIPNKNSFRSIFTDIKNEILKDEITINKEMVLDLGEMIYEYASINKEEKIINKFVINFIDDSDILVLNIKHYELIRDNMGKYHEEIKRLIENKIKTSINKEKLKEFAKKLEIELTNSK